MREVKNLNDLANAAGELHTEMQKKIRIVGRLLEENRLTELLEKLIDDGHIAAEESTWLRKESTTGNRLGLKIATLQEYLLGE